MSVRRWGPQVSYSEEELREMQRLAERTGRELLRAGFKGETFAPSSPIPGFLVRDVAGFEEVVVGFHKKQIFVMVQWEEERAIVFHALAPKKLAERLVAELHAFEGRTRLGSCRGFSTEFKA